jgi:hypothetical protein
MSFSLTVSIKFQNNLQILDMFLLKIPLEKFPNYEPNNYK